jgi:hypothetical protein
MFTQKFFIIYRENNKSLKDLEKEVIRDDLQRLSTFLIDAKSTEFSAIIHQIVDN